MQDLGRVQLHPALLPGPRLVHTWPLCKSEKGVSFRWTQVQPRWLSLPDNSPAGSGTPPEANLILCLHLMTAQLWDSGHTYSQSNLALGFMVVSSLVLPSFHISEFLHWPP